MFKVHQVDPFRHQSSLARHGAVSWLAKTRLRQASGRLPARVSVIREGISDRFKPMLKFVAKRRLSRPVDCHIVPSVGRDRYPKNLATPWKVMNYLKNVEDDELVCYSNAADVLAFPSNHEDFGLDPLEAMKCGVAVVTTHDANLHSGDGSEDPS